MGGRRGGRSVSGAKPQARGTSGKGWGPGRGSEGEGRGPGWVRFYVEGSEGKRQAGGYPRCSHMCVAFTAADERVTGSSCKCDESATW